MKKIRNYLRNFEEKRLYQIAFFLLSMCVILGGYWLLRADIVESNSQRYYVEDDENFIKYIEEVGVESDILSISGWCLYNGIDSSRSTIQVFLRNINDEEDIVWLDVEEVEREDINEYLDCEINYRNTGFCAFIKTKEINLQERDYEIFLKINFTTKEIVGNNEVEKRISKTVSTKRYISEGELSVFKPGDTTPQKVASKALNEVFDNGEILAYNKDADVYVYQYQKKIYWIAGSNFYFEKDGTTYIQYQLTTNRIDKLPKERVENEWYWDNWGFTFESYEFSSNETQPYRVAVRDVPCEYPVLYFVSGYVDNAWVWREHINIDIRELNK